MRWTVLAALLLAGCQPRVSFELPESETPSPGFIVVVGDEAFVVEGGTLEGLPPLFVPRAGVEVWALSLAGSLESLQLVPGPLELSGARSLGGGVVAETRLADAGAEGVTEWRPAELGNSELSIAAIDWGACAKGRGCSDPALGDWGCRLECPLAPEPMAPKAPECVMGWGEGECAREVPASECAAGTHEFYGQPGCVSVPESPCPNGVWAEETPPGAAFVLAGTSSGAGTRASPFGTIREAVRSGARVVAVGAGVYAESLILDREVAIAGACAGRTRVTLSSSTSTTAFEVIARNVSLRGLSIAGGVRVRGEASLEDLVLERLEVRGRTRLTEALLRRPPDSGIAVMVRDGGALEMERVVVDSGIEGFPFANIQCTGADSSLVATDLIVAGGGKGVEALFGCMLALEGGRFTGSLLSAVEVSAGARATVRTVWMEKCWGAGIRVLDDQEGAEALVEDVAIEGTETAPGLAEELLPGFGIQVWGGKLSGARVYLASNRGPAIHLEDGTIALEDVVARNNGPGFEQTYPTVAAQYHGTLTLTRAEVRGAAGAAVHAASGAELRLSELTIADPGGPGIYTSSYGALTLERVSISGATDFGVKLELNPLRFDGRGISIRDLTVRDTRGDRGAGMSLDGALAISMSRFLIERNGASGVWVVGSGDSGDSGDLHIAGGVVRGHSVGLIADPLAPKTSRLIEGVHLDANDTAIAR